MSVAEIPSEARRPMAPFNDATDGLVAQAIERAAQAIAYNAQSDSTVLSRHHRRERSALEEKLLKLLPIALAHAIDEIEDDGERLDSRRRPRRTIIRKGDNGEDTLDMLAAFGQLGIRPGDTYVVQRQEDA